MDPGKKDNFKWTKFTKTINMHKINKTGDKAMRVFKFYDAVKNDFAIALFYEKELHRVEYIHQGRAMDPGDKIEFEAKIQHNNKNVETAEKEGFIHWWEKYGTKMSMVTKNGFKFYCVEITQPTHLINCVTDALTELIDYEHTDQVLKIISNNFRTVLKQFHKSSMEKKEIAEEPKEEMVVKKW